MGIIKITKKDAVIHLSSDSVMTVQENSCGEVRVIMKPIKVRDVNNPTLIVDYCQEFDFQAIEPVEFFNV